jgi:uncharacterized OB-fold protein
MSMMVPTPAITPDMEPFFDAARRQQLALQRCRRCHTFRFPARPICSSCLSTEAEWVSVSGRGEIFSFNVMHQVYHPAFAERVPYAVVLVKLAEGPKMTSNLVGVEPHDIRIGMPVQVVFEKIDDEVTLPKFAPAPDGGS